MTEIKIDMNEIENEEALPPKDPVVPPAPKPADTSVKPKKSKKKLIVAAITVVLMLAIGAYFVLGGSSKSDSTTPTSNGQANKQASTKKKKLLVYQDPKLYAIEGTEKTTLATVEPNSVAYAAVIGADGKSTFYYAKQKDDGLGLRPYELMKSDGTESKSLFNIPKSTYGHSLSKDGKYFAYTEGTDIQSQTFHIVSTTDGKDTKIEETKLPVHMITGFDSKNRLVLQEISCLSCDGPMLTRYVAYSVSGVLDKTVSYKVNDDAEVSPGSVLLNEDGSQIYVISDPAGYAFLFSEEINAKNDFTVARTSAESDSLESIFKKKNKTDVRPSFAGTNYANKKAYIVLESAAGTPDGGSTKFDRIVEADKSGSSDISLDFATLKSGGSITQVISLDGKTLYIALNTKSKFDTTGRKSLVSLPYLDENATTTTLFDPSASSIQILGVGEF